MDPPTEETRKPWLYAAAVAFAVLPAFAASFRPEGAWPLVAMAVASGLVANVDKFANHEPSGRIL